MAKITELVKTYRLLSDPNAPDWNVKFIGGIALALGIIVAGSAAVWSAHSERSERLAAEASAPARPEAPVCSAEQVSAAAAAGIVAAPGDVLPAGCVVPRP